MKHAVFGVDELEPGKLRSVQVDGIAILIVRTPDGSFRALRDICPHLGVQLSRGDGQFAVEGDHISEYAFGKTFVARCSWHGYEYDVDTGECIADRRWRVKTYPVSIEDGMVTVERR